MHSLFALQERRTGAKDAQESTASNKKDAVVGMTNKTCLTAVLVSYRLLCEKPELRRSFASLSKDYIMPAPSEQKCEGG